MFEIRPNIHFLLFVLVSFISLYLQYDVGGFKPIIFHDSPYPIDTLTLVNKFGSLWRDIANFGYFDPSGTFLSFWYLFLSPIYLLTYSLVITQFVFLFIICNVTLFGSYTFARHVGINKIFSILAAISYLANPFSIFYVWRILNANIVLYAMLPLIFLCVVKIIKGENSRKYFVVLLLSEFLSLPGFANLAYYVSFAFVTLLLSISYSIVVHLNKISVSFKDVAIKNLLIAGLLILPLSAYLMSTFETQPRELSSARDTHLQTAERIYLDNTRNVSLPSLFSLTALPPLYEKLSWFNYEYIYLPNVSSAIGIAVASIIVITLTIRLVFFTDGIMKTMYPLIAILVVLSILLLRDTGYLLLRNSPVLLLAFRDPYHKFETEFALVLIVLFCYCVQEMYRLRIFSIHKFLKIVTMLIVVFISIYWSWPFITGNFVPTNVGRPEGNLHPVSAFTDMPSKYAQAVKYLRQDKEIVTGKARVLVYPLSSILWCDGNGKYWGNDILRFSGISTVSTVYQVNFQNESKFISSLSDNRILSDYNYASYMKKLGIKYILLKKQACDVDTITGIIKEMDNQSEEIRQKLSNSQFNKVMENQYYYLFEIANGGSSAISIINNSLIDSLKHNNTSFPYSSDGYTAFLLSQQATGQHLVQYQKISSTEYVINVKNNYRPSYLIFVESYDDGWKAFINGNEQIPDKYHFSIAGFANAWYLDKAGYLNIRLYFIPQMYHDIGLAIYILIICLSLIYLLYAGRRSIRSSITKLLLPSTRD